ncbi:hypothetical protein ACLOJK_019461 [Asimina triloba]
MPPTSDPDEPLAWSPQHPKSTTASPPSNTIHNGNIPTTSIVHLHNYKTSCEQEMRHNTIPERERQVAERETGVMRKRKKERGPLQREALVGKIQQAGVWSVESKEIKQAGVIEWIHCRRTGD